MNSIEAVGATCAEWHHFAETLGLRTDLLPVVARLDAPISKTSKLERVDGKTPSKYNADREVVGVAWSGHQATARQIAQWSKEPDYSIGLIGRNVAAIDIDIEDSVKAAEVREFIAMGCGDLPCRSRAGSGRMLLLFRHTEPVTKTVIKTPDGAIEVLGNNQQFLVAGTHKSGTRYEWRDGLPVDIPTLSAVEIEALIEALERAFGVPGGQSTDKAPIALQRPRNASDVNDPDANWLAENGWAVGYGPDGRVDIRCPWADGHTPGTGDDSSTSYFPAGLGGFQQGHFKCMHASCSKRTDGDFRRETGLGASEFSAVPTDPAAPEVLPAFARKKNGQIEVTRENLTLALQRSDMCGWQIRHDTFKDATMIAPRGTEEWRQIADADKTALCRALEDRGAGFAPIPLSDMRELLHYVATQNTFDSAQQWLTRLEWDGTPRVASFLTTYLNAADTSYNRAVSRYMWTALPGRVIEPGVKADMVPVLQGPQGTGKSSVVAAIAPSFDEFLEHDIGLDDEKAARLMRGKLVIELGELRGLRMRQIESLKSFITRRVDEWVPKYVEHPTRYRRRSVFIGTTNCREFLTDDTGHRRWLPVEVLGHADVEMLKAAVAAIARDRDQLWAEGAMLFAEGGVLWEEAEALAKFEHAKFEAVEPWEARIAGWLGEDNFGHRNDAQPFTVEAVLVSGVGVELKAITSAHRMRVAQVLRKLGYVNNGRRMLNGVRAAYWERTPQLEVEMA